MESVLLTDDDQHLYWVSILGKWDNVLDTLQARLRYWTGELFPAQSPDTGDIQNLEKAASVYRSYQQLHRENSLPGRIGEYYYREQEVRRVEALAKGELQWFSRALQRWVMGYGERPWRVLGTSLVAIVGFGLVYPFVGGMEADVSDGRTEVYEFAEIVSLSFDGCSQVLFENLYFNAVTFTTLGYGDIQPASTVTQLLATVESFVGALLMALLVAVLARQTMR